MAVVKRKNNVHKRWAVKLLLCLLMAGVFASIFLIRSANSRLRESVDNLLVRHEQIALELWQSREFAPSQRGWNKATILGLHHSMQSLLDSHPSWAAMAIYNPRGFIHTEAKNPLWDMYKLHSVSGLKNWNKLGDNEDIRFFSTNGHKMVDIVEYFNNTAGGHSGLSGSLGAVRVILCFDEVESQLHSIASAWIVFIGSISLLCVGSWFIFFKTFVLRPIEKKSFYLQSVVYRQKKYIQLAEKIFIDFQKFDQKEYLLLAKKSIINRDIALTCAIFITQELDSETFEIETTSEQTGETLIEENTNVREYSQKDFLTVKSFLQKNIPCLWIGNKFFIRSRLFTKSNKCLVSVILRSETCELKQDQFESLIRLWMQEIANTHYQVCCNTFISPKKLAQNLIRKQILSAPEGHVGRERVLGYAFIPTERSHGDFLAMHSNAENSQSIAVLGDVNGNGVGSAIAATALTAIATSQFRILEGEHGYRILEIIIRLLNNYLWENYQGKVAAGVVAIVFNHQSGQGLMACYGMPFPYLILPQQRKPLAVVPVPALGFIGVSATCEISTNAFSVIPEQVLFACSSGLLNTVNSEGKRFEKIIQRGMLSDLTQRYGNSGAQNILNKYFDCLKQHANGVEFADDVSGIVLKMNPENENF